MSTTWRGSVALFALMSCVLVSAQPRVRPARVVRSGEVVVTRAVIGGVEATGSALAQQSGALGDVIRVINRESRRSFKGRIVAPGQVEVLNER
ncbi:MAG: flagella basal body P-ring formation protein FlgA [Acidobacteria bacterium]|nr:flagella basal body P-ring formation protein FlgA [Acidobacteriota bacterium]